MLTPQQVEQCLERISHLDRQQIVEQFRRCRTPFPIDFTDDWLRTQPLEELRHVLAAICIQCDVLPEALPEEVPVRAA